MNIYPLLMMPHFRHGEETPWGGNMLRDAFLKEAPGERTGESLEVSALPGRESVVRNGAHSGETFSAMISLWGEALTGKYEGEFPLLLKLLDARETLSVQVHPGDEYARTHEGGKLGKTEAWIILSADEGAKIAYDLNIGERALEDIVREGAIESALNWQAVRPGDVFYIPSGMVHALGGGIQCYEIQQSSDVTYRIFDWGRVGADGQPRELHTHSALDVSVPNRKLGKLGGTTALRRGGSKTYYISNKYFELSRLNVSGSMPLDSGRMLLLTPLGECTLTWDGGELDLGLLDTVVVPAALEGAAIAGEVKVLLSSLPDGGALCSELGYRADDVAGMTD